MTEKHTKELLPEDWEGKTPTPDQWREILEQHAKWLSGTGGSRANLSGANLSGADLSRANLSRANLSGANGADLAIARTRILPEGDLIGWKKCRDGVLVKLVIPAQAKRSHAWGRKCRAEYVRVLEVVGADHGVSIYDGVTRYVVGAEVRTAKWDEDWTNVCSDGIHFYLSRIEAEHHQ